MRFPLLARVAAIVGVALAILLPIQMIDSKIAERSARAEGVTTQFASETSGPQLIVGPLIALTCEETYVAEREVMRSGKAETISETKTRACPTTFFTPRTFTAKSDVPVETLHRGIYSIRTYRAELAMQGEFEWPQPPESAGGAQRKWKQAYLVTFVEDPRGIKAVTSSIGSELLAGTGEASLAPFSIRESLGTYAPRERGSMLPFSYRMSIAGTSRFEIAPVGDRSEIRMSSNWPHPSFSANWSPDMREIGANGFDATWRMTSVSTGGAAGWNRLASAGSLRDSRGAGLGFFDPVNVYALSYRATQYAFLFVLFTFTALALAEVLGGVRLHPIQYALIGSALAVFFLLLIALSEHIPFARAYTAAAAGCVTLLVIYLRHPLGTLRRTALFLAMFVSLYASLYVLLRSEDHALLLGSLMVFVLLAAVMISTRKFDWPSKAREWIAAARSTSNAAAPL